MLTREKNGEVMRFDEYFLQATLTDSEIIQRTFPDEASFSVDTRSLEPGDIFIALIGAAQDGHAYIVDALSKGAAGIIIAHKKKTILHQIDPSLLHKKLVIAVADTFHALIRMAMAWRDQFSCPVIGITGSVGKTSTKEMIGAILNHARVSHLISRGNQNTRIGLALNMLRMRSHHKAAIFEMGISKEGEMAELARILRPTNAVITMIGHSHMAGLGSLHDIALEKRDIFKYFTEEHIGIINGDVPLLTNTSYKHPVIKFGAKTINQIQARRIIVGEHISFILKMYGKKYTINLPYAHEGMITNVLAAVAIAYLLRIDDQIIIEAIQQPIKIPGRFEKYELTKYQAAIIHDAYNANPESMKAALLAFDTLPAAGKKTVVLGDMLELGTTAAFWHRQLGRFLRKVTTLDHIILVGSMVEWTRKTIPIGVRVDHVANWQEALTLLKPTLDTGNLVLVKGSRGMHLDKLVLGIAQEV